VRCCSSPLRTGEVIPDQLQAKAIDNIDRHITGVHTLTHNLGHFKILARYRLSADSQLIQLSARNHDAEILAVAQATTARGGGVIGSWVTEFCSADMR
jgi:hypothetical protein